MLQAYFDESGTHWGKGGSKVFVLCGYIAPEDEWGKFEIKWKDMLRRNPTPKSFHAVDLESRISRAKTHEHKRKFEDFKMEAVNIPVKSGVIGVSSGISMDAYDKLVRSDKEIERQFQDPYMMCFQFVIAEAIHQSRLFIGEDQNEKIAFIFDQSKLWSIHAHKMYNALLDDKEWENRCRLGSVTFEAKERFAPLQAADNLAYETWHYMSGNRKRPVMRRFLSWPQHRGRYYDEKGLGLFIQQCKMDGKI